MFCIKDYWIAMIDTIIETSRLDPNITFKNKLLYQIRGLVEEIITLDSSENSTVCNFRNINIKMT